MITLRIITTDTKRHSCRHRTYTACCPDCIAARAAITPAICECDRPSIFRDPTADLEPTCLRCGRPASDPSLYSLRAAA